MNVSDYLLSCGHDDDPAVFHLNIVMTYAELRRAVAQLANGLVARGHLPGARIGICSENSPFFVTAYLGVMRAGLVAVPLTTDISAATFARVVREAGIRELLVSRRFHRRLLPWAEMASVTLLPEPELPGLFAPPGGSGGRPACRRDGASRPADTTPERTLAIDELASPGIGVAIPCGRMLPATSDGTPDATSFHPGPESPPPPDGYSPSDFRFPLSAFRSKSPLASLMFTSGSTGVPKGVMVTHGNIASNTRDIVEYMGLTPADRAMVVLPFHYCFGLSVLHSLLAAGGSLVLNNQFMYPESVLADMVAKACTGLAGVPSTYQILLRKSRFKQMPFPALRWFQQAGGKLHNPFIQEIQDAFPQVNYFLMYGQTEATARLSYLPPVRLKDKLGSIGQGLPSTRLAVLKPDGTAVTPGSDEVGEVVAFGPNVTLGYWNDPDETAKYFRAGGLYTGDLARVDADGFIFIVEREREMIKSGGNRVSAKEVEDVIAELPPVVEVAVIGISHELLGEAIQAFVVVTAGAALHPEQIILHCQRRLPAYKCPESVVFLPALPHNSAGKVIKGQLKQT